MKTIFNDCRHKHKHMVYKNSIAVGMWRFWTIPPSFRFIVFNLKESKIKRKFRKAQSR